MKNRILTIARDSIPYVKEIRPIAMELEIEQVDWDELPDDCFEESEAALPY